MHPIFMLFEVHTLGYGAMNPNVCTSNSNSRYIEVWKVIKQTTHSWIEIINSTTCFWKRQLSFTNEVWDNLNITIEDCMSKEQCNLIQCYNCIHTIICTCTSALKELTRHWVSSPISHSWKAGSLSIEWFQPRMKRGSITSVLHQQASQTALANKFCNIMKAWVANCGITSSKFQTTVAILLWS